MSNENIENNNISKIYDKEAEKSVISSMLQDSTLVADVKASLSMHGDEFSVENYKKIFNACMTLSSNNDEINLITVRDCLISIGEKGNIIELDYLKDLATFESNPMNIKAYLKIIKDKYVLRCIIDTCENVNRNCVANNDKTVNDILKEAQDKFYELSKVKDQREYEGLRTIIPRVLKKIKDASRCKDGITGIKTGLNKLDIILSGLQRGNLIIIGARPGAGKTAFALNLAYGAVKEGSRVAFFSLEMTKEEIAQRALSMESKVNSNKMRSGSVTKDDWKNMLDSTTLMNDDLIIDDTSNITVVELRNKCKKIMRDSEANGTKLDAIFIDYVQLMEPKTEDVQKPRHVQIGGITRELKGLAKDLNIPIVALAQTRRPTSEADENKERLPRLEDLRESGSIEQDADVVIFLHRPEKKDEYGEESNKMLVMVAKHRNGSTENISLQFDRSIMRFDKYEENPNIISSVDKN